MDVRQMAQFHMRRCADLTVAAVLVLLGQASSFGAIHARSDGRIDGFRGKPAQPPCMPEDPHRAYALMGNDLFDPAALIGLLEAIVGRGATDFGDDVLPHAVRSGARAYAYDFATNRVRGLKAHDEAACWRDAGRLEALAETRREIEGPQPRFELEKMRNGSCARKRARLKPRSTF